MTKQLVSTRFQVALAAAALVCLMHSAVAEEQAFGRKGDLKKVSRTVDIDMSDAMRFAPAELAVKQGDTVRFRLKNSGKVMHEMVLGTMQDLEAHAEAMRKDPHMHHHGAASMVHIAKCARSSFGVRPFPTSSMSGSFQWPGPA